MASTVGRDPGVELLPTGGRAGVLPLARIQKTAKSTIPRTRRGSDIFAFTFGGNHKPGHWPEHEALPALIHSYNLCPPTLRKRRCSPRCGSVRLPHLHADKAAVRRVISARVLDDFASGCNSRAVRVDVLLVILDLAEPSRSHRYAVSAAVFIPHCSQGQSLRFLQQSQPGSEIARGPDLAQLGVRSLASTNQPRWPFQQISALQGACRLRQSSKTLRPGCRWATRWCKSEPPCRVSGPGPWWMRMWAYRW